MKQVKCYPCFVIIILVLTEETASLLTELANIETKKGTAITASTALSKEREQVQTTSVIELIVKEMSRYSS